MGIELLDDLPWREASLVGVGTGEIEIELVERGFGEELGPAPEGLQVVELVLDEAVHGLDVTLVSVGGGRDALVVGAKEGDGRRATTGRPCAPLRRLAARLRPTRGRSLFVTILIARRLKRSGRSASSLESAEREAS